MRRSFVWSQIDGEPRAAGRKGRPPRAGTPASGLRVARESSPRSRTASSADRGRSGAAGGADLRPGKDSGVATQSSKIIAGLARLVPVATDLRRRDRDAPAGVSSPRSARGLDRSSAASFLAGLALFASFIARNEAESVRSAEGSPRQKALSPPDLRADLHALAAPAQSDPSERRAASRDGSLRLLDRGARQIDQSLR